MNFVRCEQCGAKALVAASQCPRCAHPLGLRDFRGETVPLAHCRKCDTYYPRRLGGCRWCGTKANALALSPRLLLAGIGVVVAAIAVGSWQWWARAERATEGRTTTVTALGEAPTVATPPTVAPPTAVPAPSSVPSLVDSALAAGLVDSVAADAPAPRAPDAPAPRAPDTLAPKPSARIASSGPSTPSRASATPVSPRYAGPWTRATALNWVNVRGSNSPTAAVVGVVTPNTPVQLGELRAGWRRVRSAGVEGWADARYFRADTVPR